VAASATSKVNPLGVVTVSRPAPEAVSPEADTSSTTVSAGADRSATANRQPNTETSSSTNRYENDAGAGTGSASAAISGGSTVARSSSQWCHSWVPQPRSNQSWATPRAERRACSARFIG
jgi:hypothetical protein